MSDEDDVSSYNPMFFTQNYSEKIEKLKIKKTKNEIKHILNNKMIAKHYKFNRNIIFHKIEQRRAEM
jgi:hypothetical protein